MTLTRAWSFPAVEGAAFEIVHVRGRTGVAFDPDSGALLQLDLEDGGVRWRVDPSSDPGDDGRAQACAVGPKHVLTSHHEGDKRWRLDARRLEDGAPAWSLPVEAGRVGRLFANERSFFAFANVEGLFVLLPIPMADPKLAKARPLDRRRGLVGPDGRHAWTRDRAGLSELDILTGERVTHRLPANGVMSAGPGCLMTTVAANGLTFFRDGARPWSVRFGPRDLGPVAARDGVGDEGEEDVWNANLGRGVIDGDDAFVPDLSGALHRVVLADGRVRWTAEAAHYPSSQRCAMPAAVGERVLWAASDEHLYEVHRGSGRVLDAVDLGAPFERIVGACPELDLAIVPGVAAYRVGDE